MKGGVAIVVACVHICSYLQERLKESVIGAVVGDDGHMQRSLTVPPPRARICAMLLQPADERHVVVQHDEMESGVALGIEAVDLTGIRVNLAADPIHLLPLFFGISVAA